MTLLAPERLWALLGLAALVAGYVTVQRRRRRPAVRLPTLAALAAVVPRRTGWRRHVPPALAGLALGAAVVGLALPAITRQVPRAGTVVLAIDTSGSMGATDVTPTRLKAAEAAVREFLKDAPARLRVGLVSFGLHGHVLVTPTTDRTAVAAALSALKLGPGTAIGDGVETAVAAASGGKPLPAPAAGQKPAAAVVLLTDGGNNTGATLPAAAAQAAKAHVPVDAVAFGTAHGTVHLGGRTVAVPVDPAGLAALAATAHGHAYSAASTAALHRIYEQVGRGVGFTTQRESLVRAFTGAALALLLAAAALGIAWAPRLV